MKKTFVGILAVATLALTGCGSDDQPESASPTTPAVAAPTLEVVAIGTPFAVKDKAGATLGTVTVLAAEKNPACTDRYGTPATPEGIAVAVQLRVETPADFDDLSFVRTTERDFSEVTTAGVTKDVSVQNDICIADRDQITKAFTASSKYEGWILLDVSDPQSKLIYRPQYSLGGPSYQVVDLATASEGAPAAEANPEPSAAPAESPEPPRPASSGNTVDQLPNPYPNSQDSYGRATGTSGATLVGCAQNAQAGTGLFSDGSMDYAAECLKGGSMWQEPSAPAPAVTGHVIGECAASDEGKVTTSSKGTIQCSNGQWITVG